MSNKVALLIGVSEYGDGIPPLSAAPNDVEAMQRVLADPYLGGFDEVKSLINPNETEMKTAILQLFANRDKEDLLLLFFSGHGITDDDEHLYLTTRGTSKDYFRATAVPANFVQKESYYSRAKRQVIILDCCYSGAFAAGWQAKSVGVDIKRELGGEGRVVLTSSTATQVSFQQEGSTLSLYTQYLVEGIETGAADTDGNGAIYVRDLHDYAKRKVQNVKPNMKPDIILDREGFNILLAKARKNAEAEYRQIIEKYARNGEISKAGRLILQQKQQELGIANAVAERIESEVLEPFRRQRLINLELYREAFREAVEYRYPLAKSSRDELNDLQDVYGLRDEEVAEIEKEIIAKREGEYRRQEEVKQTPTHPIISPPSSVEIGQQKQSSNPKASFTSINEADNLSSAKGVDYTKLRDLLAAGKWKEADQETGRLILIVAGRQKEGWLRVEDIDNFPCEDLRSIDHLWVKYSNGRFGFSIQKPLYESLGGTRKCNEKIWEAFGDRVGWRKNSQWLDYDKLIFNIKAPEGHLPQWWVGLSSFYLDGGEGFREVLLSRVESRNLTTLRLINETDNLTSAKGVDYTKLRDLLAAGKWRQADEETRRLILMVAGRETKGWLDSESIEKFPCPDLRTIDTLWVKYSNGRFGFSVQKRIWESVGGKPGEYDHVIFSEFALSVGWMEQKKKWMGLKKESKWKSCEELIFSEEAPLGYLPSLELMWTGVGGSLFSRRDL